MKMKYDDIPTESSFTLDAHLVSPLCEQWMIVQSLSELFYAVNTRYGHRILTSLH